MTNTQQRRITKSEKKTRAEGGDVFGKNEKKPREEKREKPRRFVDFLDEPTRIEFLREGIYVGPAAWVGPGFERTKPWDLPQGFDIDGLEDSEIRVAVRLGILTRETLTAEQLLKFESALKTKMPKGTAASLMGKLAMLDSRSGKKPA